jgi:hypothetical protein
MSKKPLHLQQKRYEVRSCYVWSKRAENGRACNYWYIHDTLNDSDTWSVPTLNRSQAFKTRKQAVARLNERLAREQDQPAVEEARCFGLEARFRF